VNGSDVFGAGFFAGPQKLVPIGVIAHNKAPIFIVPALPVQAMLETSKTL
jgi:hypothetical protein